MQKTLSKTSLLTAAPLFQQTCVIGLGLIGASLAQAIKDNQLSARITAVDRHAASVTEAIDDGLLDAGSALLDEVVAGSDLIVMQCLSKRYSRYFKPLRPRWTVVSCRPTA